MYIITILIHGGRPGPSTEAVTRGLPARSRSHEGRSITGEADRLGISLL